MKVRRQVDNDRHLVRLTFEFPLDMDPDRAADVAWEYTSREIAKVQARRGERVADTVAAGLRA